VNTRNCAEDIGAIGQVSRKINGELLNVIASAVAKSPSSLTPESGIGEDRGILRRQNQLEQLGRRLRTIPVQAMLHANVGHALEKKSFLGEENTTP
jgi:hypothetical protein